MLGLPLAAVSGMVYGAAGLLNDGRLTELALLIVGRILMGLGESLFLTGLMTWGIGRLGAARTGVVMSWTGIAIYAAIGLGASAGLACQATGGLAAVGGLMVVVPLLAMAIIAPLPAVPAAIGARRVPFHQMFGLIWRFGSVLALATVPFAAMSAFLTLDYAVRGWPHAGSTLAAFAAAYIAVRLFRAHLPDRLGAAKVASGSLLLETIGQVLVWAAPDPAVAIAGTILTGLGFSLIFPCMGVLATQAVPPDLRGRALGNFIAFADMALGLTGPLVGIVTHWSGIATAFLIGAIATGAALCLLPQINARTTQ